MITNKIKFTNSGNSLFYATVKQRVDEYFNSKKLSIHANANMWFKAGFYITGFLITYFLLLFAQAPLSVHLGLALLLGIFAALIGFNVCHDAIHNSFSSNPKVNKALGFIFNILGANPYVWGLTHNLAHHTYTNISGHDEDIDVAPGLLRLCNADPVNKLQTFQHYYAFFLYSFSMLSWVFRKDYKKFFQTHIGQHKNNHPKIQYFNLFFYKILYYTLFIMLPIFIMEYAWWQILIGFTAMLLIQGLVLGLVFQLAHVVEGTDFPSPNDAGKMEEAWAVHQLRTTANFSSESKIAAFICGGLNRQIEHHIFPKICHIHYPEISKIVKSTALEFNLPYNENSTFLKALASHYRMLKVFGRDAFRLEKLKHTKSDFKMTWQSQK